MQPVILVCGVPGSGKSWVCEQLKTKFDYIAHDDFIKGDYVKGLLQRVRNGDRPILGDCPFAERLVKEKLEDSGAKVIPIFIVEDVKTIKARYEARDAQPIPKQHLTRAAGLALRANEWRCFFGTSTQVLEFLQKLEV